VILFHGTATVHLSSIAAQGIRPPASNVKAGVFLTADRTYAFTAAHAACCAAGEVGVSYVEALVVHVDAERVPMLYRLRDDFLDPAGVAVYWAPWVPRHAVTRLHDVTLDVRGQRRPRGGFAWSDPTRATVDILGLLPVLIAQGDATPYVREGVEA
jgi:hypothetical protein